MEMWSANFELEKWWNDYDSISIGNDTFVWKNRRIKDRPTLFKDRF